MTTYHPTPQIKSPTPKKSMALFPTNSSPPSATFTNPKNTNSSPKTTQEENHLPGVWFTRTDVVNMIANIDWLEKLVWNRGLPYLTLLLHVPYVMLLIILMICSHLKELVPNAEFNLKDFPWIMWILDQENPPLFNHHKDLIHIVGISVMWLSMIQYFILKKDSITGAVFVRLFQMNISNSLSKKSSIQSTQSEVSLQECLHEL